MKQLLKEPQPNSELFADLPELRAEDDPIPKVFAYFCQQAGKTIHYRLTDKRYRMAKKRWAEEAKAERAKGIAPSKIRGAVGTTFKNVIDEICDSDFHKKNRYLEWEQLFGSEDRFTKWADRYENGFAEQQHKRAHQ